MTFNALHRSNRSTHHVIAIVILALTGTAILASCNRGRNERAAQEAASKMQPLLAEMGRQARPEEKTIMETGKIFVNLKGFDIPVVGVAVPNKVTGKRVLVSFTEEHFKETEISVLAHEGLEDFERALKVSQPENVQPSSTGAK